MFIIRARRFGVGVYSSSSSYDYCYMLYNDSLSAKPARTDV